MASGPAYSLRPRTSRLSSSNELLIPTDLLIEILKRLPLKSLIRSSCVCKSWHSLLTSPTFISAHVSHNLTKPTDEKIPNLHLFKEPINIHSSDCRSKFFLYNPKSLAKQRQIRCPVGRKHFLVSSCDGLLCLFDFYSQNPRTEPLILWNPSIQRMKEVSPPSDGEVDLTPGGFPKLIFGVGLDSVANDYKVIRAAYSGGSGCTRFQVHVYGLSVGKWKSLNLSSVPQNFSTIRWRGVCLNGVIHWVCNLNANFDDNNLVLRSILTFQLRNEKFGEIILPKELSKSTNESVRVLTVPRRGKETLGVIHKFCESWSLWVMEEYGVKDSWVKLFCVNTHPAGVIRNDMNVGLVSEEVVIVQAASDAWISYDVMTEERKSFKQMAEGRDGIDYVDPYIESLILLGQGKAVSFKRTRDNVESTAVSRIRNVRARAK